MHSLVVALWDKAVHTPGYDKEQWMKLADLAEKIDTEGKLLPPIIPCQCQRPTVFNMRHRKDTCIECFKIGHICSACSKPRKYYKHTPTDSSNENKLCDCSI
jgi:hypothetical protein